MWKEKWITAGHGCQPKNLGFYLLCKKSSFKEENMLTHKLSCLSKLVGVRGDCLPIKEKPIWQQRNEKIALYKLVNRKEICITFVYLF